ncbi:DedA family protein [Actinoplanes sp. NPDC026670]|uniref:DedA family protein n=1 Tax=Actinoplanes sp. NPDC026670 TaxID=3154700 RepID=UPI003408F4AA
MPLICSPWLYVIVFVAVTVDGFFPIVPSETVVISLGALSATGSPHLLALLAVVVAGGIAGDRVSCVLGRKASSRLSEGKRPGSRPSQGNRPGTRPSKDRPGTRPGGEPGGGPGGEPGGKPSREPGGEPSRDKPTSWRIGEEKLAAARKRAEGALRRHGAVTILVGRFLPYGRTATGMMSGSARMPMGRFSLYSTLASVGWAIYVIGLGRLGGMAFSDSPLLGTAFGLMIGMSLAAVCALTEKRWTAARQRRRLVTVKRPVPAATR